MKKTKCKYMHTLNEKPASFYGEQICYSGYRGAMVIVVDSLKQIRKEQEMSKKFRKNSGFYDEKDEYDYVLIDGSYKNAEAKE